MSQVLETKMGIIIRRCPAGKQVFVTWAGGVVPSCLLLTGLDTSLDMRLVAVLKETATRDSGFGRVHTLGCGHQQPTWLNCSDGPGQYSCVHHPTLGGPKLLAADCSLFALTPDEVASKGADPAPGAGHLFAESNESPDLAS